MKIMRSLLGKWRFTPATGGHTPPTPPPGGVTPPYRKYLHVLHPHLRPFCRNSKIEREGGIAKMRIPYWKISDWVVFHGLEAIREKM